MSTVESKKRLPYIDIGKGIAMILVILGHSSTIPQSLLCIIYSFHMPLFFALSGYTFSVKKDFKTFLISKIKGLLIPYFFLCLILLIFHDIFLHTYTGITPEQIGNHLIGILIGFRNTKYYFSMWFILVLFISEIILYFFIKQINKIKYRTIVFAVSAFFFPLITFFVFKSEINISVWSIDIVPAAVGFIIIGYLLKENSEKLKALTNIIFFPVFSVLNILCAYLSSKKFTVTNDLFNCQINNYLFYILGALFGICAVFVLCINLKKCRPLEYIGKNSIIFYAFQNSLFIPISIIILRYIKRIGLPDFWVINAIGVTVITCIFSVIATELINNFTPFVLGKFEMPKLFRKK